MSDDSSLWTLLNLHTGEPEEARLFNEVKEQHVIDVEDTWKPMLDKHLAKLKEKHHYDTPKFDKEKFFTDADKITDFAGSMACDQERFKKFFHAMLDRGVYLAPSAFEAGFVSAAHTDADIANTLSAAAEAFASI